MNPYSSQTIIQPAQNYDYSFPVPEQYYPLLPVVYAALPICFYPQPAAISCLYRSSAVVITSALQPMLLVNQLVPAVNSYTPIQYVRNQVQEDMVLDAFGRLVHPFETFLERGWRRVELEANLAPQTTTSGGSGLTEERISEYLRERTSLIEAGNRGCESEEEEDDICAVCLGEYEGNTRMETVLQCGHGFRAECIKCWLLRKNVCPICRATALTE